MSLNIMENTQEVTLEDLLPLIRERVARGQTVRLYPKGVSMLPMLRPGVDSVILSGPPARLKKYDLPLYRRADGSFVLHRVMKVKKTYTCKGDNQSAKESGVDHSQVLAVVTGFYRDSKYYSVKHPIYWIYCSLWHRYRSFRILLLRGRRWIARRVKGLFRGE